MSSSAARTSSTATRCRTPGPMRTGRRRRGAGAGRAARAGRRDRAAAGGADRDRRHRPARADPRAARPRAGLAGGGGELSAARPRLPCLSTGSAAFDRILGGGLPVRSVNVIAGEPGAGKTIFALQMLFHQARQGQEGPLPDDAVRAVAEAHQLHAAVLVLRRAPDRRQAGGLRRPRLGDATQGRRRDARRDHRPRRARGARDRRHRQLQGAPGSPRRRPGDADLRLRPRGPHRELGGGEPARRRVHGGGDRDASRSSPSPTASSGSPTAATSCGRSARSRS